MPRGPSSSRNSSGGKNYCYDKFCEYAGHVTRKAEVPYKGNHVPGWLHLPPNYKEGDKVPVVIAIGGHGQHQGDLRRVGRGQLPSRGIATFLFDGAGQYSSAMRGIYIDEEGFYDAGRAVYEWPSQQPEIDLDNIAGRGVSMGSIWGTQVASVIPNVKACSVVYPSYEKGKETTTSRRSSPRSPSSTMSTPRRGSSSTRPRATHSTAARRATWDRTSGPICPIGPATGSRASPWSPPTRWSTRMGWCTEPWGDHRESVGMSGYAPRRAHGDPGHGKQMRWTVVTVVRMKDGQVVD